MALSPTCWFSYSDSGDIQQGKYPSANVLSLSVVVAPQCLQGYSAKRLLLVQGDDSRCPTVERCCIRDRQTFSRKDRAIIQKSPHRTSLGNNLSDLEYGNSTGAHHSRVLDIVLEVNAFPTDTEAFGQIRVVQLGIDKPAPRKRCSVIFESIIPSIQDTQFFVTLTSPPSIPFARSIEYGLTRQIEHCSFQILPLKLNRQSSQALDRIPASVVSLIAEYAWTDSPLPGMCKSILDLALVQKSWAFLTEVYFKKISSGYHIYNPQGLLRSLIQQPTMTNGVRSCILSSNRFLRVEDRPDALASLLDLDLPLRSIELDHLVFNRSKNRLASFSHIEKFRLATELAYGPDREIFDDIEEVYKVVKNFSRLVDLEVFISSYYAWGKCIPRKPLNELTPFSAPFSLQRLSITRGEYTLSYLRALLGPSHRPSLRTLELTSISALRNKDVFMFLMDVSPTLEKLILTGNTFQSNWSQPGVSPVDHALPYLTQLRYLGLEGRKACTSTATIALKPPLEGRSKTVIWIGVVNDEETMSEALEMTGWTDLEFRGNFGREWQAPKEEWLEIANRRDIRIRSSYDGKWLQEEA